MSATQFTDLDHHFMREAVQLASQGLGYVEPNPLVGAIVVTEGTIVGRGYHPRFGHPHAEILALDEAADRANDATLYVTLEPCNHFGKTPPCTERIIQAGVKRVVAAMADPNPIVAGKGFQRLKDAGIEVQAGCLETLAKKLNAPYLKRLRVKRPYVHAKWAVSLDGRTITHAGHSKWITGEQARQHAHRHLRGRCDAILVGKNTVLADDPALTARPPGPRQATRVIVDSKTSIPLDAQLVRTARDIPTLLVTTPSAPNHKIEQLRAMGCEVLLVEKNKNGQVSIDRMLDEFGKRDWTNVLVEGGAEIMGAFADADEIDAAHVYIAPIILGGHPAGGPVRGQGVEQIQQAIKLEWEPPITLGNDIYLTAHKPIPS